MNNRIVDYFKSFCKRYKLSLNFIPDPQIGKEAYVLHYRGRSILTVNIQQFFQIPPKMRRKEILALFKIGLSKALDDASAQEQIYTTKRWGKIVIK